MKPLVSILACLLFAFNAYSAPSQSTKIHNPYSSLRALGMGNAFTAVADDYSLIMYNPAGFAKKKHNEIQISLVGAGVASKTTTIASDIKTASDTPGSDSAKAQAISDVLDKYYGQALGGKVQALEMFWVRNGWGVALLPLDMTVDMSINRQVGPAIDLNIKGDTTIAFGFGGEWRKNFDAGLTAKYVHRISVEEIVPAFELATDSNVLSDKRFKEGTAADFDIGFKWKPDWFNSSTKEIAPAVVETITPPVAEAKPVEAAKVEEKKTDEKKSEDKKEEPKVVDDKKVEEKKPEDQRAEEESKPQAEGDATEAKVAEEAKPATPTEAQELDKAVEDAKTKDAKAAESKPEDKKVEVAPTPSPAPVAETPKPETKVVEEAKTKEVRVAESDERFPLAFGLVVHNVIGGEFTLSKMVNKSATEVPTKMYRVVDIGSEYLLRDGEDFKIRYMIDFKNLGHTEISLAKSFHTGIEFDYSPSTWFKTQFRAGLNQMYYTAGASFLFGFLNIDAATYGEEVGTQDTKLENRVYAAKLGFNF